MSSLQWLSFSISFIYLTDCSHSPKILPGHKGGWWIRSECLGKAGGAFNCGIHLGGVTGGGGGGVEEGSLSGSGLESSKGACSEILIFLQVQKELGKSSKSSFDAGAFFEGY